MAHVYVDSAAVGAANGTTKADAYTALATALAAAVAGDQIWVSKTHNKSTAGAVALTSAGTAAAPITIACVDFAGSTPPASADLSSGAIEAATGANSITCLGYAVCDGIEFKIASGSSVGNMDICNASGAGGMWVFGALTKITMVGTGAGAVRVGSTGAVANRVDFNGVTVKFSAVGQFIRVNSTQFTWKAGGVDPAGSAPTTLFTTGTLGSVARLIGVDLSALGSGKTIVGSIPGASTSVTIERCAIDPAATLYATPTSPGSGRIVLVRSANTAIGHSLQQIKYTGTEVAVVDVRRRDGSPFSMKYATNANAKFILPYDGIPLDKWNGFTQSGRTVTIEGVANMPAIPKNDEFWIEVEYPGTASSPLSMFKSGAKANILAAAASLTASTEAWDVGATTRGNSTAYALGDPIKLASNPGRVFFCTTAGTSAGSEPGGFASAVDGDSVTDGTAVFRAGFRFKQAIVLSAPAPLLAGPIYVYPKVGAASASIYADPKLAIA